MRNLIVIGGIKKSGTNFMLNALKEIIRQSGYTYTDKIDDEIETDFILIKQNRYDIELDLKAKLVFTSTRFASEVMEEMNCNSDISTKLTDLVLMQQDLIYWMRSSSHAYCMDYNSKDNEKALYNFNNLNRIIGPMKFMFKDYSFEGLVPTELIKELQKLHPVENGSKS